jgi:peptidoglycan hydrolase-like protein with peptidoglycan-binding domain
VAKAQRTLTELGYYLGAADGRRRSSYRSAVMAFQKVQGLAADGTVGPATLKALYAPRKPVLAASSPSNRVEVDLTKQVLYVVKGGAIQRILPVSSGNGATYEQKDGSDAKALTPTAGTRSSDASSASARPTSARSTTRSTSTGAGRSTAPTACRPARPATAACA